MMMLIPVSLSLPAVSFMSEVHSLDRGAGFSTLVGSNLRLVWGITLPLTVTCAILSSPLILVIFGRQYERAGAIASLMSFVGLLMVLNSVVGNAIAASGKMWHGFLMNLGWFGAFLAVAALLIPVLGVRGLAMAFAFSYCLLTLGAWSYTRSVLGISYDKLFPLLVLTAAAAPLTWAAVHLGGVGVWLVGMLAGSGFAVVFWRALCAEPERAVLRAQVMGRCRWGL
jgi:O-antigen/teichoic acid export membrane protein